MIRTTPKKSDKAQLMLAVKDVLQKQALETQEEIRLALLQKGFDVNQVSVSRIMNKLGVIKIKEGETFVYRFPVETSSITARDYLSAMIVEITRNEMMIVVHTTPGSAQLIARLLDQQRQKGILGTVAGDDTIFVAPVNVKKIETVLKEVTTLLLGCER